MSESEPDDKEISSSKVGGRINVGSDHHHNNDGDGGDDDDDQEDDDEGDGTKNNKTRNKKSRAYRCGGEFGRAKVVVLLPFRKAKNFLNNRKKKPSSSSSSSSSASATGNCCFCLTQSLTLESSADSCTSDPNDPKFSFEMLRTLIEKNDFYSKECNTHLGAASLSSSSNNHG